MFEVTKQLKKFKQISTYTNKAKYFVNIIKVILVITIENPNPSGTAGGNLSVLGELRANKTN